MKQSYSQIYSWIKTPCGRAKYQELVTIPGIFARIRVIWFVVIASLKDWHLPNPDKLD